MEYFSYLCIEINRYKKIWREATDTGYTQRQSRRS